LPVRIEPMLALPRALFFPSSNSADHEVAAFSACMGVRPVTRLTVLVAETRPKA
jgi:hypothetical protein